MEKPAPVECAAEGMAADIRDNLRQFEQGERDDFNTYFPLNLDENGAGEGVHDLAHELFFSSLSPKVVSEEYLVLPSGVKLYYLHLADKDSDVRYSAHYSSEPILFNGSDTVQSTTLDQHDPIHKKVNEKWTELRDVGQTAVDGFFNTFVRRC